MIVFYKCSVCDWAFTVCSPDAPKSTTCPTCHSLVTLTALELQDIIGKCVTPADLIELLQEVQELDDGEKEED